VIDWVMRAEGVSFRHAVELLRGGPVDAAPRASRGTRKKLDPIAERDVEDDALLVRVTAFYAATLHESPEGLAYLEKRGIGSEEAIRTFRLGYSNRTLGYRLPDKTRRAGAELRGRLERIGVYRGSGHEHLAGSIVVPPFDAEGRVVQLYGRKVRDNLRAGTPMHLYLPGPQRGIWNRDALAATDEVILCESIIDALTFWCAGLRNVTTAYGIEGYTDELHDALVAAGVKTVRIAFDRDEAGDRRRQPRRRQPRRTAPRRGSLSVPRSGARTSSSSSAIAAGASAASAATRARASCGCSSSWRAMRRRASSSTRSSSTRHASAPPS
jgi:DNA primase